MSNWVDNTIWWQVYPLGFCGAPIRDADHSPAPRLRRLLNWLDYLIELGANGLLLGPIFKSKSHGYDTLDHFEVDARLGGSAEVDQLVAQCHERGIRVLLDGVFSHVGYHHPLVQQALAEGRDSEAAQLFDIDWDAEGGPQPRVFEGHGGLVRFNHANQATVDLVTSIMCYWLERGVDGWRLDAAYSVDPQFWSRVLPEVRRRFPQVWILGEVIHGEYAEFVRASGVDSVTQYELWKSIWSSLKDENLFELDWTLTRHNKMLESFTPQTFIGNHDVTRIASTLDPQKAIAAAAILLTLGGIPSIYSGDEQGFTGVKEARIGGDDSVRPPFPPSPSELLPFGEPVFEAYETLIGIRRRHPWLVHARTERIELGDEEYRMRVYNPDGDEWLILSIEQGGRHVQIYRGLDQLQWSSYTWSGAAL